MDLQNFKITVDLSHFFIDYRSRVKIYISKDIKTINDITNKIISLFGIDKFHLTSGNDYLPPCEDVRILEPNEVLNAIPAENEYRGSRKISSKKAKKRKSHKLDDNSSDSINFHNYSVKKRKKKMSFNAEVCTVMDSIGNPIDSSYNTIVSWKKKKRSKTLNLENQDRNTNPSNGNNTNMELAENLNENKSISEGSLNEYIPKTCKIFDNSTEISKKQMSNESSKRETTHSDLKKNNEYKCKGDLSSYVRKLPVPTITHKYLNDKKINIVKIDVVSKPTTQVANQSSISENDNVEHSKMQSTEYLPQILVNSESIKTSPPEIPTVIDNSYSNFANLDKKNPETPEDMQINSTSANDQRKIEVTPETNKTSNKPSNPKRKFFFFNSSILTPNVKDVEEEVESDKRTEDQIYRPKYFTMPSPYNSPKITTITNLNDEIQKKCQRIESTPSKNEADQKTNQKDVDVINDITCEISGLLSVTDDSTIHKTLSPMSGLQELPSNTSSGFVRPNQYSGVGHLLEELKSQHSSPINTFDESECSEFIAKRKRKRVRKRKNPKPQIDIAGETPLAEYSNYSTNSLNTKACPSVHVKFQYENEDDNNIKVVNVKGDTASENNIETINVTSDKETSITNEDTILKAPLMKNTLPKIGDIIAFKILRMAENYTPEFSSFITGKVIKCEENSILFDIIAGIDQCREPSGKFSVQTDGTRNGKNVTSGTQMSYNWNNIICPRLLYP